MHHITMIMLLVVAAIHLLPLVGACGKKNLFGLYGVSIVDPNVLIPLRYRAVLFGLLGGLLVVAAPDSAVAARGTPCRRYQRGLISADYLGRGLL